MGKEDIEAAEDADTPDVNLDADADEETIAPGKKAHPRNASAQTWERTSLTMTTNQRLIR